MFPFDGGYGPVDSPHGNIVNHDILVAEFLEDPTLDLSDTRNTLDIVRKRIRKFTIANPRDREGKFPFCFFSHIKKS